VDVLTQYSAINGDRHDHCVNAGGARFIGGAHVKKFEARRAHVTIRNNVGIHSQVFVPEFSALEDGACRGPNVVLTNAKYLGFQRRQEDAEGHPREKGAQRCCPVSSWASAPSSVQAQSLSMMFHRRRRGRESRTHHQADQRVPLQGVDTMSLSATAMSIPLVDLKSQYASIKAEIDTVVTEVLSKAAFIGGAYLKEFETAFARYCNAKHCVGVGNGTDALFIALKAQGIGPGDEVITVANSFIATSEAITSTGARVVFADIDPATYTIDPEDIEKKITSRTKAIIPVHLYGQPADMDAILALAKTHNLKVIEDAAQAHGAVYKGRTIGTIGECGCFSFYPGKNLGAYGDAGGIVTNDDQLALRIRMFANHGRVDKYDHELEGINSRLDALQAAILSIKLRHLSSWTERRRENARLFNQGLAGSGLITPVEAPGRTSVYHLYVVRVPDGRRAKLQDYLKAKGVSTGIHYPIALPNLKAYASLGHTEADFPQATKASKEILSLPMYAELGVEQVAFICEAVREAV
jgi:dTDP-4-amino-4,6-dideoxygalactose transaminase